MPMGNYGPRVKELWEQLMAGGMSPGGAAGMLGNVQEESSFDPNAYNSLEAAQGLFQKRGSRATGENAIAEMMGMPQTDPTAQVAHTLQEIAPGGTHAGVGQSLGGMNEPRGAAAIVDQDYEISDGKTRMQRMNNAGDIFNEMYGGPANSTPQGLEALPGNRDGSVSGADWTTPDQILAPGLTQNLMDQPEPNSLMQGAGGRGVDTTGTRGSADIAPRSATGGDPFAPGGTIDGSIMNAPPQQQEQAAATGGLNYDEMIKRLGGEKEITWQDRLGAGLSAFSEYNLDKSGGGQNAGNTQRRLMVQNAAREQSNTALREKAGMAATMSRMPGGEKFAEMLANDAPLDATMNLYEQSSRQHFEGGQAELANRWATEAAKTKAQTNATAAGLTADAKVDAASTLYGRDAQTASALNENKVAAAELTRGTVERGQNMAYGTSANRLAFDEAEANLEQTNLEGDNRKTAEAGVAMRKAAQGLVSEMPEGTAKASFQDALNSGVELSSEQLNAIAGAADKAAGDTTLSDDYSTYVANQKSLGLPVDKSFDEFDLERRQRAVTPLDREGASQQQKNRINRANTYLDSRAAEYQATTDLWRKVQPLGDMMRDPSFGSGPVDQWLAPVARVANDLGLLSDDLAAKVYAGEEFEAGEKSIYTSLTSQLKGAITDREGAIAAQGNLEYGKSPEVNRRLFDIQERAYNRKGAEMRFIEDVMLRDKDPLTASNAQYAWDQKVAAGDPDTLPIFVDIGKGGWSPTNVNNAVSSMPNGAVVHIDKKPYKLDDQLRRDILSGELN